MGVKECNSNGVINNNGVKQEERGSGINGNQWMWTGNKSEWSIRKKYVEIVWCNTETIKTESQNKSIKQLDWVKWKGKIKKVMAGWSYGDPQKRELIRLKNKR